MAIISKAISTVLLALSVPAMAADAALPTAPSSAPSYALLADFSLAAPTIIRATIAKAERISTGNSPGLAAGQTRFLVTANTSAAIVAPGAVPATLNWLWDAPLDARGKPPKPKGQTIIAWLTAPLPNGQARLVAAGAQIVWDAATEARIRAIAVEARSGSVPVITGVTNGFRADGTIPGESESQFFLSAADGKGAVLIVTSTPGAARRIAVSRGDIIDESAAIVKPRTLLWYRLACFLPAALPASAGTDPALAADWSAAIASLGPCDRAN